MALSKFNKNVENIIALDDNPNEGATPLTSSELKEKFDQAGVDIKDYINNILTSEIDTTVTNINGSISNLNTNLSGEIGSLDNLTTTNKSNIVSAANEINAKLDDTGWQTIPLQSGVTVGSLGGTPKCRKIGNVVYVMGGFKFNKGSNPKALAILPEGYRPITQMYVPSNCTGYRTARTYITDEGVIGCDWIYNLNNDNAYTGDVDWYQFNVTFLVN